MAGGATRRSSRRLAAALGVTAWLVVGAVAGAASEARAADARRVAGRTAAPPGWSCTPGLCRPRPAAPVRDAAAFGLVVAGAGWIARRRAAPGS